MAERKEPPGKERKGLGIAVVGSGRIGTLRASLAAAHPAVRFLAVSDMDLSRARTLADRGFPHGYVPGHSVNMAFLSSTSAGDWALGDFWGPVADETRAWLDHLSTGRDCVLATPEEARTNLEVTLAVEKAVRTREAVKLPLTLPSPACGRG